MSSLQALYDDTYYLKLAPIEENPLFFQFEMCLVRVSSDAVVRAEEGGCVPALRTSSGDDAVFKLDLVQTKDLSAQEQEKLDEIAGLVGSAGLAGGILLGGNVLSSRSSIRADGKRAQEIAKEFHKKFGHHSLSETQQVADDAARKLSMLESSIENFPGKDAVKVDIAQLNKKGHIFHDEFVEFFAKEMQLDKEVVEVFFKNEMSVLTGNPAFIRVMQAHYRKYFSTNAFRPIIDPLYEQAFNAFQAAERAFEVQAWKLIRGADVIFDVNGPNGLLVQRTQATLDQAVSFVKNGGVPPVVVKKAALVKAYRSAMQSTDGMNLILKNEELMALTKNIRSTRVKAVVAFFFVATTVLMGVLKPWAGGTEETAPQPDADSTQTIASSQTDSQNIAGKSFSVLAQYDKSLMSTDPRHDTKVSSVVDYLHVLAAYLQTDFLLSQVYVDRYCVPKIGVSHESFSHLMDKLAVGDDRAQVWAFCRRVDEKKVQQILNTSESE